MSIGSRIRFIRKKRELTQKDLGIMLGFAPNTAEVRIAQYETDSRIPRDALLNRIADVLNISIDYLNPNPNTVSGVIRMLYAMEDDNMLQVNMSQGKPMLSFQQNNESDEGLLIQSLMQRWAQKAEMLRHGDITQEEYDQWRWNDIE